MKRRIFLTMAAATLVAACVTPQEPVQAPTFVPVGDVKLSVSENASFGLLKAQQDTALVGAFEADLLGALGRTLVAGGTENVAEVEVTSVTIQTGASRIVAAAESLVRGNVIVRGADGSEVARFDAVEFANSASASQATFNGIPIGALVSMARNARGASPEEQVSDLADGFSQEIAALLGR